MLRTAAASDQLLLVYHQLELQTEFFGSLAAEYHSLHKYLKIIHYGTKMSIYRELELDDRVRLIYLELCLCYGIIHPVVDIKG